MGYPRLNLPSIKLRVKKEGERDEVKVWDLLRQKFLLLTPEEWVRQHIIHHLINSCGVAPTTLCCEYPININGVAQRADIVVIAPNVQVQLLVECKAAHIAITEEVASQALRYCSVVKAHNLLLTNGIEHRLYRLEDGRYTPLPFESLKELAAQK